MLLTIDVGNTTITLGLFEGDRLRVTWRIATDHERLADEYAVILLGLLGLYVVNVPNISFMRVEAFDFKLFISFDL